MKRALALAQNGLNTVSPNPMVGALVVRNGSVVGAGFHERPGEAHAEIRALQAAGDAARGATLYVTLEPCNHHGRTPPCVDAIVRAGITRVVIACADPNRRVSGGGTEALRKQGIDVHPACESERGERLIRPWLWRIRTGEPFRAAAIGRTLDGKFLAAPAEWRNRVSPPAARTLERLERFHGAEGSFGFPPPEELADLGFLRRISQLYVFVLPEWSSAADICSSLDSQRDSALPGLRLECARRLGSTALAVYLTES